jgi:hypothetical protein
MAAIQSQRAGILEGQIVARAGTKKNGGDTVTISVAADPLHKFAATPLCEAVTWPRTLQSILNA